MLLPEAEPIVCPKCVAKIRITVQAAVRANDPKKGTTIDCRSCGGKWVYFVGPPARFEALSKPRRRKSPKKP